LIFNLFGWIHSEQLVKWTLPESEVKLKVFIVY